MIGPYERLFGLHQLYPVNGRIDLNLGAGRTVTATLLSGDASIELIEKYDDLIEKYDIQAFGQPDPIRFVNQRQKLRLVVEADLDGMTIEFNLPGYGEAATSPDSRRRS